MVNYHMGAQTPSKTHFLDQETLHSLLSTG